MRVDLPVVASKSEAAFPLAWPRYAGIAITGLLLGVMLWPLWRSVGDGAMDIDAAPACARWDDLARESIARLVQNGKRDADLRQAGDAIFRLRRARRNCHAGWTTLACQDYLVVARGISGTTASRPPNQPGCTTESIEEVGAAR